MNLITMSFSLDQIKEIKINLGVTVNNVLTGVIFLGTRLYIDSTSQESKNGVSTALVLFNTWNIGVYTSVAEMIDASAAEKQWGTGRLLETVRKYRGPEATGSGHWNECH